MDVVKCKNKDIFANIYFFFKNLYGEINVKKNYTEKCLQKHWNNARPFFSIAGGDLVKQGSLWLSRIP